MTPPDIDAPSAGAVRSYLKMERSPRAITQLDGVRAVAIILVLGRHAVRPFLDSNGELFTLFRWDVATPFLNGWMGVDLFFVLSGFLIATSLMRLQASTDRTPQLKPYLLKRILRIVPTYFVVLIVAALGLVPYYEVAAERLGSRVVYHLLFFQDYFFSDIVAAFWSLGVEEKFYLTAPFVWYGVSRLRGFQRQYAALAVLVLLGPLFRALSYLLGGGAETYDAFFFTFRSPFHMSLDPLYVGVIAALIYRDRERFAWTRHRPTLDRLFWGGALMVGWLLFTHEMLAAPLGLFDHSLQPLLLATGMGAIVLALVLGGGPVGRLQGQKMFYVSKLAFSLYLVHMLVIPGVIHWLGAVIDFADLPPIGQFALFLGPYLLVAGLASVTLFYVVEKPFLRLKSRVRYSTEPSDGQALSEAR
jgi:peptidoglycan/LPS O-acetylase OafA/YrhL